MFIFDQALERDIDLLIMRAFFEVPAFSELFLLGADLSEAVPFQIEHSFTDPSLGESDITILVKKNGRRHGLLIENKIDAEAQPNQYQRYCLRGEEGIRTNSYDSFSVFLTAPQKYLDSNEEAQKYPNRISYENMLTVLKDHNRLFDTALLAKAIEKKESGYTVQEVPAITLFWEELYQYACASSFRLEMVRSQGAKGGRSFWPRFKTALKGTALYYKSNVGFVDLEFSGKLSDEVRIKQELAPFLSPDMIWATTGKSLSLRIPTASVDLREDFKKQLPSIDLALATVEQLTALTVKLNRAGYQI